MRSETKQTAERPSPAGGQCCGPQRGRLMLLLLRVVRIATVSYLGVLLMFMMLENSMIFQVPPADRANWQPANLDYQDVFFESDDGTPLHGWYVEHPDPKAHVIIFHGNASHVADYDELLSAYRELFGVSVFVFDYRGYGRSGGKPNEQGVLADARAAQQWYLQRTGIAAGDLVLIGDSLGGALAVDLAVEYGARGLVLERTFTKMTDVAAYHYPWLPVRLVMRTRLDSLSKIGRYEGPLFQSHGTSDEIVPLHLAEKLHAAAASKEKVFFRIAGAGHNQPPPQEYWRALGDFFANLP